MPEPWLTRRSTMAGIAGAAAAAVLPVPASARPLAPPTVCTPGTPSQTEGPLYTPSTPHRGDLREPDSAGEQLVLEGLVLTPGCRPLPGAMIDVWHCDENGRYDNRGFRYRGHDFTDAAGAFRFRTIRPGRYPDRTPHIHVKVQGRTTPLLTTQLYFPDLPYDNIGDSLYRNDLALRLERAGGIWLARFDFVLPTGRR